MRADLLTLRDFRNYAFAELPLCGGVNVLCGENAQGKTNALEAVGLLSTTRLFRSAQKKDAIRFGAERCEVGARFSAGGREMTIKMAIPREGRPQLEVNGVRQKRHADAAGLLRSVLFCPEDLLILKKGAAPRRRLLDNVIVQLRPNYAAALSEYNRLLDQKSAVLKDWRDNPSLLEVLPEYNTRMAQVGALIISYRARFLKALEECAAEFHTEFSGGTEQLTIKYKTVSNIDDPFAPPDILRQKLAEHQAMHERAELDSAQCLSGPHKDDFEAALNGLPINLYASQGQTRTATISIKLAERELMKRDSGEEPILLLDDVLSELDAGRQDFVLNKLKSGQVFITCCETDRLTELGQVLRVEKGAIL